MKDNRFNPPRREWPKTILSPDGVPTRFDCLANVPPGWIIEHVIQKVAEPRVEPTEPAKKRGPGRPPKDHS